MPIKILIYGFLLGLPPFFVYLLGKRMLKQLPAEGPKRIELFHKFRQQVRKIQIAATFVAVFVFVTAALWDLFGDLTVYLMAATVFFVVAAVNAVFFRFDRQVRRTTAGFWTYFRIYFGSFFVLTASYIITIQLLFLIQDSVMRPAELLYWIACLLIIVYGLPALSPFLMRLFYKVEPFKDAALKARLEGFLKKVNVKCRDILQFETDGIQYSNAIVSGLLPEYRYIYFSSYLLKRLKPSEAEAVFAHEVAHIKRKHIMMKSHLVFLLYLMVIPVAYVVQTTFPEKLSFTRIWLPIAAFVTTYMVLSRIMSKRHERQCDEFVVDHCPSAGELEAALKKLYSDNYVPSQSKSSTHPTLNQRLKYVNVRLHQDFLAEAEKNLESYYVMDQIGRLRFFTLESWEKIKASGESFGPQVQAYVEAVGEYNRLLKDFKDFEEWYAADVEHKTQDNGRTLHAKKEAAGQKFKGLDRMIKPAVENLKKQTV